MLYKYNTGSDRLKSRLPSVSVWPSNTERQKCILLQRCPSKIIFFLSYKMGIIIRGFQDSPHLALHAAEPMAAPVPTAGTLAPKLVLLPFAPKAAATI